MAAVIVSDTQMYAWNFVLKAPDSQNYWYLREEGWLGGGATSTSIFDKHISVRPAHCYAPTTAAGKTTWKCHFGEFHVTFTTHGQTIVAPGHQGPAVLGAEDTATQHKHVYFTCTTATPGKSTWQKGGHTAGMAGWLIDQAKVIATGFVMQLGGTVVPPPPRAPRK